MTPADTPAYTEAADCPGYMRWQHTHTHILCLLCLSCLLVEHVTRRRFGSRFPNQSHGLPPVAASQGYTFAASDGR